MKRIRSIVRLLLNAAFHASRGAADVPVRVALNPWEL